MPNDKHKYQCLALVAQWAGRGCLSMCLPKGMTRHSGIVWLVSNRWHMSCSSNEDKNVFKSNTELFFLTIVATIQFQCTFCSCEDNKMHNYTTAILHGESAYKCVSTLLSGCYGTYTQ